MTDKAKGDRPRAARARKQIAVLAGFAVICVALAFIAMDLGPKARKELGTYSPSQLVVLKKATIAGVTKDDYYKVFEIAARKDTRAVVQMVKEGKAFLIPLGSSVRVEKKHLANCEIMVLDGTMKGRSGWVHIGIFQ